MRFLERALSLLAVIFAMAGLFGFEKGLFCTLIVMGVLTAIHAIEAYSQKKKVEFVLSLVAAVCAFLSTVLRAILA